MQGFNGRIARGGTHVLRLHYSADPRKDPTTPIGAAWLDQASSGYPSGVKSPRWRKEMEIDYGALSGQKLFPLWEQWRRTVVVSSYTPTHGKLYGSYDHGWRHPACFLVHAIDKDGTLATIWEFHAAEVPYTHIASIIKGHNVVLADGRRFTGNPYAGRLTWIVADPSLWQEDQVSSEQTMKSVATLFRQEGVTFLQGIRGGDTTVAEWLIGHYWADPTHPSYVITADCPKLVWELGQQRHRQYSAQVAQTRSQPEELVDRDNDAWDALKYFLNQFPVSPKPTRPASVPATFAWWRKQSERATRGEPLRTYRREAVG